VPPVRVPSAEYQRLALRAHELLHDVPLYDVWTVDLPGGGPGRRIADIRALESATEPSRVANALYGLRGFLGRVLGWDRIPMRPEDSRLSRLSERDRRDSEVGPGTPAGQFLVLYQFPGETLSEIRNATVHGFVCTALVPSASAGVVAHATLPGRNRAVSTHPVPGSPAADSARVARRLRRRSQGSDRGSLTRG
jgi:hypothetical protein